MFKDLSDLQIAGIAIVVALVICYLYKQMEERRMMESLSPTIWGKSPSPVVMELSPPPQPTYNFYPTRDSSGNNIRQDIWAADNVPALTRACNQLKNCMGFSTDGSLKYRIIPQSQWKLWTTNPNKGLYVKQ